jgi:hypothetical protein
MAGADPVAVVSDTTGAPLRQSDPHDPATTFDAADGPPELLPQAASAVPTTPEATIPIALVRVRPMVWQSVGEGRAHVNRLRADRSLADGSSSEDTAD